MKLFRFWRVNPEQLPVMIPREFVHARQSPFIPAALLALGYRDLGTAMSRDATVWVPGHWYRYAQLELWLTALWSRAFIALIRLGFFRADYEGAFFVEHRFDPPDLWGAPIRRHERSYAKAYKW